MKTKTAFIILWIVFFSVGCKKPINHRKKIEGNYAFVVISEHFTNFGQVIDTLNFIGSIHYNKWGFYPFSSADNVDINFLKDQSLRVSYDKSGRLYFDSKQAFDTFYNNEDVSISGNFKHSDNQLSFIYSNGYSEKFAVTGKK